MNFPGGSVVKNPPANAGDSGSVPGMGRFPGDGRERLVIILVVDEKPKYHNRC